MNEQVLGGGWLSCHVLEHILWKAHWTLRKYINHEARIFDFPYEVIEIDGNLMLNEGINELWTQLCGGSGFAWNSTNAQLVVGSSTTPAAATQTDILGSTSQAVAMNGGYPTYGSAQKVTFQSDFAGDDGVFSWQEFSVWNGAYQNKNLNRLVSDQGTKVQGQTWTLTLDITLS